MKQLKFQLDYLHPWPNQIGFFVARHLGWYRKVGIDLILTSDGWDRGTAAEKVMRREFDMGLVRLGELLETNQSDHPLVGIATLNQRALEGIFSLKKNNVRSFRDLENKVVAMPSTHPGYDQGSDHLSVPIDEYPTVPRMLEMLKQAVEADGGDFSKVIVRQTPLWESDIRAIEKGYFDVIASVPGWESFQGVTPPEEVVRLRFDEVGVAPHHSYFLSALPEWLASNEQMVRRFLEISEEGFRYAADNPEKAIRECGTCFWNVEPKVLLASLNFMCPSWFDMEGRWGTVNYDLVRGYTQWMIKGGFTTAKISDIDKVVKPWI